MNLSIYSRDVFGERLWYVAHNPEAKRALQTLTHKLTLCEPDLSALEALGHTFTRDQNADPRSKRKTRNR